MDTVVSIQIVCRDPGKAKHLLDKSFVLARKLADQMNSHNSNSEISQVNMKAFSEPVVISKDLERVIKKSLAISRISHGAFDITVAPLLRLWPIYKANKFTIPDRKKLDEAIGLVGWQNIELDALNHTIHFKRKGMAIDLGGIAKGYIVDRIVDYLKRNGIKGALVNAGGDIYALGRAVGGELWRVGIQHPRQHHKLIAILEVENKAVVTSGDYERFLIKDGVRYTHIVDPRTGFTVRKTASVTLVGDDTAFIDGLATAIMVVGATEGYKILGGVHDVDGLFVTEKKEGKLDFRWTPHFITYVSWASFLTKNNKPELKRPHSSIH